MKKNYQFILVQENQKNASFGNSHASKGTDYISLKCNYRWKRHFCPLKPKTVKKCGKKKNRKCCKKQRAWWCCSKSKHCNKVNDLNDILSSDKKSGRCFIVQSRS